MHQHRLDERRYRGNIDRPFSKTVRPFYKTIWFHFLSVHPGPINSGDGPRGKAIFICGQNLSIPAALETWLVVKTTLFQPMSRSDCRVMALIMACVVPEVVVSLVRKAYLER